MTNKNALLLSFLVPLLAAMGCSDPGVAKTCLPGSVDCGNGCVQLQQDQLNCGTCGNACSAGKVCSGGTCALSCQGGLTSCSGTCRDLQNDDANCGTCGNDCSAAGPGRACSAGACVYDLVTARNTCFLDVDPVNTGIKWTVCSANATSAWISSVGGGGQYHAEAICKALGYSAIGQHGGNCGNVCSGTPCPTPANFGCTNPGPNSFDNGGATCGSDALGQILCFTVHWQCVP